MCHVLFWFILRCVTRPCNASSRWPCAPPACPSTLSLFPQFTPLPCHVESSRRSSRCLIVVNFLRRIKHIFKTLSRLLDYEHKFTTKNAGELSSAIGKNNQLNSVCRLSCTLFVCSLKKFFIFRRTIYSLKNCSQNWQMTDKSSASDPMRLSSASRPKYK